MSLVTIGAADWKEYHGGPIPVKARLYANKNFRASDGTFIQAGRNGKPDFYQEFDLTLAGTNIRIESGDAHSTTDSDKPDATYTFKAYDANGRLVDTIFTLIKIYPTPNPATWEAITEYSKSVTLTYPPTYMSTEQIEERLATILDGALRASSTQIGVSRLDTDPSDMSQPIAVGVNSPLVSALASPAALGRTKLDTTPVDPNNPIAVGVNSPLVTTPASTANLGKTKLDVEAVDPANPIAIGPNSPILASLSALASQLSSSTTAGNVKTDVAPLNPANPIAVGANSPRVAKDLALDYSNSFQIAKDAILANNVMLAVTAPVTVSSDVSLPANIQVDVRPGGLITVASTRTLTIASLRDPGNRQIFAGTGNILLARASVAKFNTAWWTGPVSGGNVDKAFADILASVPANSGGSMYIPEGVWTSAGSHGLPSNLTIEGAGMAEAGSGTTLRSTAAGTMLSINELEVNIKVRNITLDGNHVGGTTGFLCQGTGGVNTTSGNIRFESVAFLNFVDGFRINAASGWQVAAVSFDAFCVFVGNTNSAIRSNAINSAFNIEANIDVPGNAIGFLDENSGAVVFKGTEFAGTNYIGDGQTMKQTLTAGDAITVAGNGKSLVTAAGMPGTSKNVLVPLTTAHNTAALIAAQFRTALANDPDVTSFFRIGGTGLDIYLIALDHVANDGTMNFTIDSDAPTATVTQHLTATPVTNGSPDTAMATAAVKITGAHGAISFIGTQDEGFASSLINDASDSASQIIYIGSLVQSAVRLNQACRVEFIGCNVADKIVRDSGTSPRVISIGTNVSNLYYDSAGTQYTVIPRLTNFTAKAGGGLHTADIDNNLSSRMTFQTPIKLFANLLYYFDPITNPLQEILAAAAEIGDKRLLRLGRCNDTGIADYYYDFWREDATGKLHIDGNHPTKVIATNCCQEMTEQAAPPTAPPANGVIIYAEDDGAGKTRLMALFNTGAAVQIAIQP